jgi:predicted aldo/keto reductase-like oxidoreductase
VCRIGLSATYRPGRDTIHKALDEGLNYFFYYGFDTQMPAALRDRIRSQRDRYVLATGAYNLIIGHTNLRRTLEKRLRQMRTDYIDVYQLHNPAAVDYDDPDGLYQGLLEARSRGLVRFIGMTNHRLDVALEAAASGRFDTIQFPLNILASAEDLAIIEVCRSNDVGLIAMKAMSGGLIRRPDAAFAFLRQYPNVLPIWGVQRERELDEFLGYEEKPPVLDDAMWRAISEERAELSGAFCRGCGYCQPCPAGIPIDLAARLTLMMSRAPYQQYLTESFRQQMERIEDCIDCGGCRSRCPYGLDTPALLRQNLADYRAFCAEHEAG